MQRMTTRLGRTGLIVPVCGFGGIPVGKAETNDDRGVDLICRAIDSGLTLIDTFFAYGRSEPRIGRALKGRRDQVTLVTNARARADSAEFRRQVENALRTMEVEMIDVLLIKNIDDDVALGNAAGHAETLKEFQRQGKVRFIGLSSHSPDHARRAIEAGYIDVAEVPYNYANTYFEAVLDTAARLDVGILAMKPLGGGRLFPGVDKGAPDTLPIMINALSFAMSHPSNPVLIPGIGSQSELDRYLDAIPSLRRLTAEEKKRLTDSAHDLGNDFCRACGYCRQVCPAGIPIDELLPLLDRVQHVRTDETFKQVLRRQFKQIAPASNSCKECRKCLSECPFNLPVPERLKEAFEVLDPRPKG